MIRLHLSLYLLLCLLALDVGSAWAAEAGVDAEISLQGRTTQVRWNDGDTFTFRSGRFSGKTARLVGYNTLESYGPVHRWGEWTPEELYGLAVAARDSAAATRWACTKQSKKDTYGRLLVDCPEARRALLKSGLAHVFAYQSTPSEADMKAQRSARSAQIGIWTKGRPEHIVTNVSAFGSSISGSAWLVTLVCERAPAKATMPCWPTYPGIEIFGRVPNHFKVSCAMAKSIPYSARQSKSGTFVLYLSTNSFVTWGKLW